MRKVTYRQRVRYSFDNAMSRGTGAMIVMLAILSLVAIVIFAVLIMVVPLFSPPTDVPNDFFAAFWRSLLRTLDPGTMGGDQGDPGFLLAMLGVTVVGILLVSALIGVLTNGIDSRLEQLRKGRSQVLESNHTLILGWSDQVFTILSELSIANENQRNPRVVILAPQDKVEMEEDIKEKVPHLGKTRVVCRSGSPIDLDDLEIVNPQGAKSIIVLSPGGEDPDSQVIKTILAITNSPRRRPEPYHIVAEIHNPKNMEAARLVGGTETHLIDVSDTVSRLVVQTCRQSGLSVVYTELLDFDGDEIYMPDEPGLAGKTFGEALFLYRTSCLIGIQSRDGRARINPPMDTRFGPGDKPIVITKDDDTAKLDSTSYAIDEASIRQAPATVKQPERTLILGWNRRGAPIVRELDEYVDPGSVVTVVAEDADCQADIELHAGALKNLALTCLDGDTTDRATLDRLDIGTYNHVIVLCYSEKLDAQRADARTLVTLLHLRDIESRLGDKFSIVSEMLDDRNRQLAEVTKADDFIVSEKLVSLMLSQISENQALGEVFNDLFNPEGSEVYLKPVQDYVLTGKPLDFYTVVEAARRRNEVAIGYRLLSTGSDASNAYGIRVNPDKAEQVTFSPADRVIVLAED